MCGIAGLATKDGLLPSDQGLVDGMLRSLLHRGPDDMFQLGDTQAILGATRLSIIDVSGGRQPLTNEDGTITASQNGEIYDYVELREELRRKGHTFRSDTDTEVIVHLYEEHGTAFVERLRGMFAIAIWDGPRRRLVLARDRLGKKPLFWRLDGGRLTYGSELKAILVDPSVPRRVDRDSLDHYLRYLYVPSPAAILEGVHKLPPASLLVWDGGDPVVERYWEPSYVPKATRPLEEDVEEGLGLLREAVRLRLRSDVPLGAFLSGGMDSSVVTALMAEAMDRPVQTFSIGFDNQAFDELPAARAVAQQLGTDHHEERLAFDPVALLPELADHYDEPFGDSSSVPTFRVAQVAARELKVVLTGDGGDESFGGYMRYVAQRSYDRLDALPAPLVRSMLRGGRAVLAPFGAAHDTRQRMARVEGRIGQDRDERYLNYMSAFPEADLRQLLGRPSTSGAYLLRILRAGPTDDMDRLLRADLLAYLPEDVLVKVDRATMANSLEARAPLLDHQVVEFAARLPRERKFDGRTTKVLLRHIAMRLLPAELVDRPKQGFAAPVVDWFRGDLAPVFRDLVLTPGSAVDEMLDRSVAARLLDEHMAGIEDHSQRLWVLLMLEGWARRWLRGEPASRA
ncbi:MAG: asparagine synthase (glutamine-hydrolyzing) [Chloroflexota bacterium]